MPGAASAQLCSCAMEPPCWSSCLGGGGGPWLSHDAMRQPRTIAPRKTPPCPAPFCLPSRGWGAGGLRRAPTPHPPCCPPLSSSAGACGSLKDLMTPTQTPTWPVNRRSSPPTTPMFPLMSKALDAPPPISTAQPAKPAPQPTPQPPAYVPTPLVSNPPPPPRHNKKPKVSARSAVRSGPTARISKDQRIR